VLFRGLDPDRVKPVLREAVGWLTIQSDEAIWICFDRPLDVQDFEKKDAQSGLCILRNDILDFVEIQENFTSVVM